MKLPDGPRTPSLLQTIRLIAQPTQFLDNCAQRYGDPFTVRVLGVNSPPVVFFSSPRAIQEIFALPAQRLDFGKATHVFRPLMGEHSVVLQQGRNHQRQRQLLMPPFHGDRLRDYGQLICEITEQVIKEWAVGSTISIHQAMPEITLQIILQVVFGLEPGPRYLKLKQLLGDLLEDVTTPLYSSLFFFPPLQRDWGAWSPWGHFLRRRQQIDELIYAEIQERRVQSDSNRKDVLSLLLAARDDAGQSMTDVELRDQLVSLLLLGYETTAGALSWVFYLIHAAPQVLQSLRSELEAIPSSLEPERMVQLPYLGAVCQETLRIHPIGLICVPRMVKEPVQVAGYEFEAGAILVPCIYLAHRRQKTYLNPGIFQPERFIDRKYSSYEYLPFGGGSRGCIGTAFSMYEMKLVLGTILSRFELLLADTRPVHPVRRGITLVPSGGVPMVVMRQFPRPQLTASRT